MSNGHDDPAVKIDPFAPLYEALSRDVQDNLPAPGQRLIRRPAFRFVLNPFDPEAKEQGFGPLNPLLAPADAMLSELFAGIFGTEQQPRLSSAIQEQLVGTPAPGAPAVDVTDPAVDPGDVELTQFEKFIRTARRVGRAMHGAAIGTGTLSPQAGIERLYQEGLLAPPRDKYEQALDMTGLLLSQMGIFAPLGAGVGAGAKALPAAATRPLFAGQLLGRGIQGTDVLSRLGRAAGSELTLFDALLGASYGVGESVQGAELRGREVSPEDMAKAVGLFSAFGGAIGTLFRAPAAANTARAASRVLSGLEGELPPIAPGALVGEKKAVLVNGKLRFQWATGEKKGKFAPAPTPDESRSFARQWVEYAKEKVSANPDAPAAEAAAAEASPAKPETIPFDLQPKLKQMNTIGAMYYQDQAVARARKLGPERAQAELSELRRMIFDATLPENVRMTAGGRVIALERALGESQGTPPGVLPLETEIAAVELVRKLLPRQGEEATLRAAARISVQGHPELGTRVRQLIAEGIPQRAHEEVLKRLNRVSKTSARGFKAGAKGFIQGRPVELLTDPEYGLAQARFLDETGQVQLMDVGELTPIPVAGKTVKLKSGTVIRVQGVAPDRGEFMGTSPQGIDAEWHPISEIAETSHDPVIAKQHKETVEELLAQLNVEDLEAVPPVDAVTTTGEPVTITQVGSEAATVRTRTGRTKSVPRDELRRSTATKPAIQLMEEGDLSGAALKLAQELRASGIRAVPVEREIVDFAPRSAPDPEHKILFFAVPESDVAAFSAAYRQGDLAALRETGISRLKSGQMLVHVLPPNEAQAGQALFAVELPKDAVPMKNYSALAKDAIAALQGKKTLVHYLSPVDVPFETFMEGRVYRIPEALHAAAQRPSQMLQIMTQEEQTAYFRHLIAFNETVPTEVAKPLKKVRAARLAASEALETKSAERFVAAQKDLTDAHIETVQKIATVQHDELGEIEAALARAMEDQDLPARQAFEAVGLTPETEAFWTKTLDDLGVARENELGEDVAVVFSDQVPGQRATITKRTRPAVERTPQGLRPTQEFFYEIEVYPPGSPRSLREATKQFSTPQAVTGYITREGYQPDLHRIWSAGYVHSQKPSVVANIGKVGASKGATLSAVVRPQQAGAAAVIEQRIEPTIQGKGGLTPEQQNLIVQLGKEYENVDVGSTTYKEIARKGFATTEEAEGWLRGQGFQRVETDKADLSMARRFSRLPAIRTLETLDRRQLIRIESELENMIHQAIAVQRRIPNAVADYAADFAEVYYAKVGGGPFTPTIRRVIGVPEIEDFGPRGMPQVLGDEDTFYGSGIERVSVPPDPGTPFKTSAKRKPGKIEVEVPATEGRPGIVRRQVKVKGGTVPKTVMPPDAVRGPEPFAGAEETRIVLPTYHTELPVRVLDIVGDPQFAALQTGKKISDAHSLQTQWTEALAAKIAVSPSPVHLSPANLNLARYSPTGQVVEIASGPEALTGSEVKVRFPGTGEELTVDKSLVEVGVLSRDELANWKLAEQMAEGKYTQFFKREPAAGFGKLEQDLGIYGTNDRTVIRQVFGARALELASGIRKVGDTVEGPKNTLNELMDLYRRAQWLDIEAPFEVVTREGKPVTLPTPAAMLTKLTRKPLGVPHKISDDVLGAITAIDPKLEKPFRWAVYQRAKQALGNTPEAELIARAQGDFLTPKQTDVLRIWARDIGLSGNLPLARVAVELMERRLIDPRTAQIAVQMSKEAGFLKWFSDANTPAGLIEFKAPKVRDLWFETNLGIPWKVVRRHPLARLASDLIYRAQDKELKRQQAWREFTMDLKQHGYKGDDFKQIRRLLQTHDNWFEAGTAGANPKYQYGFNRFREFFDDRKEDIVRHFLRRRVQPLKYDPTNQMHRQMVIDLGFNPDEVAKDAMLLPRTPDLVRRAESLGLQGEMPSGWTADEVESFLALQRKYKTAAELPTETPEKFKEPFDFWKRYGRKNYWPLVHEGNLAITVEREGQRQVVGWVQSMVDAVDAIKQLKSDGRVGATEPVSVSEHTPIVDDIIVKAVPAGEWRQIANMMTEQMEHSPDDIRALLIRTDRPEEFVRAPGQVHAKERKAELQPIFDDPLKEAAVYNARIARMEYRWDVMEAFRNFTDDKLDAALSGSYQTPTMREMPVLRKYMIDYFSRALGEQGWVEQQSDKAWMLINWLNNAPRLQVQKFLKGEEGLPPEIWNPKTYFRKYAARARASDLVAFQSWYRLGFSAGSAFANSMQFMTTTFPRLIDKDFSAVEAMAAWRDGIRLWRAQIGSDIRGAKAAGIPKDLQELAGLIDQTGILLTPSKHMAGAGRSFGDVLGGPPIRAGQSRLELAKEWTDYWSMFAFNGAERVNRYSTAIGALRKAQKRGLRPDEAVEAARELVRETQFLYDDLSIPSLLAKAGPLGRVMFQFKPFMLNMLSYEKDLFLRAFVSREPGALTQFGTHIAALSVLGGAVGLMHHPALTAIGGVVKLVTGKDTLDFAGLEIPLTAAGREQIAQERRQENATPEENFTNTMHYRYDDLLEYGLPGLAHLALGQRVGVSGQEMTLSLDAPGIFGPHFGTYSDLVKLWSNYLKQRGSGAALAGAVAGTAGVAFLPKPVRETPYVRFATTLAGASLFSLALGSENPFGKFLNTSEEGRSLMLRGLPTAYRNARRTWELFSEGAFLDIDGKPQHIPTGNQTEEMAYTLLGLPTIRREEYSAAIGMLTGQAQEIEATRQTFVARIARAWADSDFEEAYEAAQQARELGIDIPEGSIQRELEALTNERLQTIRKRLPVGARYQ